MKANQTIHLTLPPRKHVWSPPLALLLLMLLLWQSSGIFGQLPTGFVQKKLTTNNIDECVAMAHAPDGRIFIAERDGDVKQLLNGAVTTVHTVATTTNNEQGLLGITLHSNFAQNGKIYIYYTNTALTRHYLDVIVVNASSQVTSNTRLMEFDQIDLGYHNGGAMVFKDNHLYICIGESNRPALAQDLGTYMGKVLRLLEDGQPAPGNPYYNTGVNRQQRSIWAIGMRNPWYMSMDPQTKKMFVVNVGGGFEEINDITAPEASKNYDYGWGSDNRSGTDQPSTTILPIFGYNRNLPNWNSNSCAVTSAVAFNPVSSSYPAQYKNRLYFTDWCTGWMRSLDLNNTAGGWQEFFPTGFGRILGLSIGLDGNIYYSEYGGTGNIWMLEYTLAQIPSIVNNPLSQTVYAGDPVTLTVSATGSNPLSYQWKKDGVNIAGATSPTYSFTPTAATTNTYSVQVTNSFGFANSNGAVVTVKPFNSIPVADIITPLSSDTWAVGDVLSYSANATDAEDGTLPASAFQWEIQLYHRDCAECEHWHPGPSISSGVKSGTFVADNGGESSSNIWARLILRVTDSEGRVGIDSVDLYPKKVTIAVRSSKPGLEVIIGSSSVTPYDKTMVVKTTSTMVAKTPQIVGDSVYTFSSWAHGGAATQSFQVPTVNTTYTATFVSAYNTNVNIALTKPCSTSSVQGGNVANNATDASATSRWESVHGVDPQWIYVDLGATYSITRVRLIWENAAGKDYQIFISNDPNNWGTPVKSVSNNATLDNNLTDATGTGRYVRMLGTARTGPYGYSLYDFQVYGVLYGSSNVAPTATLTAPANNSTYTAPATIVLSANASDSDGSIAKVEFYNAAGKIGEDLTSPYTFDWTNVAAGTYTVYAKAIDNQNASTNSASVNVTVNGAANIAPTATLTAPGNNSTFNAPATIALAATASDADGSIAKVEFYNAAGKIGEDVTSPYTFDWTNVAAGTYTIYAKAIDNQNASTNSASVNITVTTSTNENLALNKPAFSSSNENAANAPQYAVDGNLTATRWSSQFADPQWIYVDLGAIYNINRVKITWEAAKGRDYVIQISNDINNWGATPAKTVTGNNALINDHTDIVATGRYVRMYGTARTSPYGYSIYELEVYGTSGTPNTPPTATLTAPANNSTYTAPATISLAATAADSDGSIAKVEFYNAAGKIGEDLTSPYTFDWTNVAAGTYTVYAKAIDNQNASTNSASVNVTVNGAANTAPSVTLTAPANNNTYTTPATIAIAATASDADGSVAKVEFYNAAGKIGEDLTSPYTFDWTNVAAGTYTIYAKAIDNLNASTNTASVSVTVNPASTTNLALNKPAFSSSNENAANAPQYAVDGNLTTTRWSSQFADPQWMYVDLGATYNINRVKITWEAAKGRDYVIQISNDINNWGATPAKTVTGNNALINDHTDIVATGRYVRMYGTARTTPYGYSIYELEVYGSSPLRMTMNTTSAESGSDELALYPNPFNDEITVKARLQSNDPVNIILTDINGYVVFDRDYQNNDPLFEGKLTVAELTGGVYTLKLFCGNQVYSGRLIKQ